MMLKDDHGKLKDIKESKIKMNEVFLRLDLWGKWYQGHVPRLDFRGF